MLFGKTEFVKDVGTMLVKRAEVPAADRVSNDAEAMFVDMDERDTISFDEEDVNSLLRASEGVKEKVAKNEDVETVGVSERAEAGMFDEPDVTLLKKEGTGVVKVFEDVKAKSVGEEDATLLVGAVVVAELVDSDDAVFIEVIESAGASIEEEDGTGVVEALEPLVEDAANVKDPLLEDVDSRSELSVSVG
ncbi:uncharacterized protein KY384_008958 [Bacidia gigantensis]|uniref:uncharacterized protein n=1 Tax=Bacidia gigantensis TaxID=2732470 RepID=UPI001D041AAB|nr:uncharacterized protein KY384_008958 [Bacidia gigantensis]KAG8525314.1 hypothetical protein KY384_008958 [Bacidia gigantensis]